MVKSACEPIEGSELYCNGIKRSAPFNVLRVLQLERFVFSYSFFFGKNLACSFRHKIRLVHWNMLLFSIHRWCRTKQRNFKSRSTRWMAEEAPHEFECNHSSHTFFSRNVDDSFMLCWKLADLRLLMAQHRTIVAPNEWMEEKQWTKTENIFVTISNWEPLAGTACGQFVRRRNVFDTF